MDTYTILTTEITHFIADTHTVQSENEDNCGASDTNEENITNLSIIIPVFTVCYDKIAKLFYVCDLCNILI